MSEDTAKKSEYWIEASKEVAKLKRFEDLLLFLFIINHTWLHMCQSPPLPFKNPKKGPLIKLI